MQDTLKMKVRVFLLIIVAITLTLILVSIILSIRDNSYYPSNLFISDFALASLPKSEIPSAINEHFSKQNLTIIMPAHKIELDLNDNKIKFNPATTIREAEQINHKLLPNITNRGAKRIITPQYDWDESVLNELISNLIAENNILPINAQVIFQSNDDIKYITHKSGYSIDEAATLKQVKSSLAKGQLIVEIKAQELKPRITLADVSSIKDVLGVATGNNISLSDADNLMIAGLDNTIILAGDSIILDDIWLENDIGIGSTTNVKAIIKKIFAKIDFIEDLVYDADANTIYNNLPSAILLNFEIDNNVLWLSVIGNKKDVQQVIDIIEEEEIILPAVVKKLDKSLTAGERKVVSGKETIITKTYQITKQGEKVKEKVLLDEKIRLGYDTIIYEGYGTIDK